MNALTGDVKCYFKWTVIRLIRQERQGRRRIYFWAMPARRFFLRFLAIYAAVFVLAYLIPEHIHRRDFDRAFFAWLHDRTPQNEAALRNEQDKNEMIKLAGTAIIASVFVTLGTGVYCIGRFVRHRVDRRRSNGTEEIRHVR
jgi:hypothetical protein